MPTQIDGLPAHILLIHIVIVFVPLAALLLVLSALWPAARRKLGLITPLTALIALVFVPVTTHAGEWLRDHLPPQVVQSPAVRKHINLGGTLLPWALGLFLAAAALWLIARRFELVWRPAQRVDGQPGATAVAGAGGTATAVRSAPATVRTALPTWAVALVAVLAIAVSVGSVVQLYRIGDAGSRAVWSGTTSP